MRPLLRTVTALCTLALAAPLAACARAVPRDTQLQGRSLTAAVPAPAAASAPGAPPAVAAPAVPAPARPASPPRPSINIPGIGRVPLPVGLPSSLPALPSTQIGRQTPPAAGLALAPSPAGATDGSGAMTPAFVRAEAQAVYNELVAGLAPADRARVAGIPLTIAENPRVLNAVAGCAPAGHRPFIAITTALLNIESSSATARARDAITSGGEYERYVSTVAAQARAHGVLPSLAPGASLPAAAAPGALAHARYLFDEQVAFVLGHELSHHYRGHTGCAVGAPARAVDFAQLLPHLVPFLQQPHEAEADIYGVATVLDVGAHRTGGAWTEEGARITLDLFGRLQGLGVDSAVMVILDSHPLPQLRRPVVDYAAAEWRAGRHPGAYAGPLGTTLPLRLPFNLPTSLPGGLRIPGLTRLR